MVRAVPKNLAVLVVASAAVGLTLLMACRSEAATPAPSGLNQPVGGVSAPVSEPGALGPGATGSVFEIPKWPDRATTGVSVPGSPISGWSSYPAAEEAMTGIHVSGQGRVTGVPDMATLTLGVESSRDTVEGARQDAANAMDKIISVLKSRGIAERDIQTRYFNIHPRYDQTGRTITGYQVSNQVSAKIRNLNAVGSIIDEASKAGGNLTRFQGISFTIENTKALEDQARVAAVKDLLAKANQLATLTGVQLGRPTNISEVGGPPPMPVPFMERAMAAPMADAVTPVLAGEMEVVVTLQATFTIQ